MALFWAGLVVAVAAAARSTWSPCGLSMLSSITPFGERARRHRYAATAAWFVTGGLAGGLCLGGAAAAGAAVASAGVDPAGWAVLAGGAAVAAAGALVDAGAFGPVLPLVRRQVDDRWLARYRPWVYGFGFGWQVGVGLATYVMTAGLAVVIGLGVLSGSPASAALLGAVFGLARGATVFLTGRASTPALLRGLHRRLDRAGPFVRWAVIGVQAGAAVGLAAASALVATGARPGPAMAVGTAAAALAGGLAGAAWAARTGEPEPAPMIRWQ